MVTREQLIEQSVQEYAKAKFEEHGYPMTQIQFLDAFPSEGFDGGLDKNMLTAGFNFDDQGTKAELGSNLTRRRYTIEWFVFGINSTWGRNLGHALKFSLEADGVIPLLNVSVDGSPEIDRLIVDGVSAEKVAISEPEPWEENVWRVAIQVTDEYFPSAAFF